jgi:hypothetical protein
MKQLTLVLLFLTTASAWAEWTRIGEVKIQGGRFTVYVDAATISRTGRFAKMWGMYDFNAPKLLTGKGEYRSIKFQNEFDCSQGRFRVLSLSWYAANMGGGELISSANTGSQWMLASSGSSDKGLLQAACNQE